MQDIQIYQKLMQFAQTKQSPLGLGNLYYMRTIDRDGNVTSESYGMNMFTNYGFSRYFSNNDSWPHYLYIGDNEYDATLSLTANNSGSGHKLFHQETLQHDLDSARNTTIDYNYPMWYYEIPGSNPTKGIVTLVCKFMQGTFDYTIDGVSEDISIREYGIGSSATQLWTHSWAYDIQGRNTTVTKTPNERLVIDVYFCMSYETSIITDGFANGRYCGLTTMKLFLDHRMTPTNTGTYCIDNSFTHRTKDVQKSIISNNTQTMTTTVSNVILLNTNEANQGYIDGWYFVAPGSLILEPQSLDVNHEEQFETEVWIDLPYEITDKLPSRLSEIFGKKSVTNQIPITQLTMKSNDGDGLWLYDAKHGENVAPYRISVPYQNNDNHWYTETSLQSAFALPIYTTNQSNAIEQNYLYINTHPEDPIVKFDNPSGITMVYGTNEYWNKIGGAWTWISNPANVQQSAQQCKFYITNTNQASLNPVRESIPFTVLPSSGEMKSYSFTLTLGRDVYTVTAVASNVESCSNSDHWVVCKRNEVIRLKDGTIHTMNVSGVTVNSTHYHYAYDKIILTVLYNTQNNVVITNLENIDAIHSIYLNLFTTGLFSYYNSGYCSPDCTFRSESNTGLICFQRVADVGTYPECVVVDLTRRESGSQNPFICTKFNAKMACAIYDTTVNKRQRIAYLSTDPTPKVKVYDFTQGDVTYTLNLPMSGTTSLTDFHVMWALNDDIYASNGSTWTWHWNISGADPDLDGEVCTNIMTLCSSIADARYITITAVDDLMIIYRYSMSGYATNNFNRIFYTKASDPSTIYNLSDFNLSSNPRHISLLYLKLQYIEDHTLALVFEFINENSDWDSSKGYYYYKRKGIIDLGQYLYPPTGQSPIVKIKSYISGSLYQNYPVQNSIDVGGLSWFVIGENILIGNKQAPLAYFMPMYLKGRTRTITAFNHIKSLSNKSFTMSYTNQAPVSWPSDENGYPIGNKN